MATSWSHVSDENANFSRLCKLLVHGGTKVLREVFDGFHPPLLLKSHLLDPKNHGILKDLQSKKVLQLEQWKKLYPTGGSTVDSQSFDITLLSLLLRSICTLPTPAGSWKKEPAPTNTNTEDDIVRIKLARNALLHIKEPAISDIDFSQRWGDIQEVLVRLGGKHYEAEIDKLKVGSLNPEEEKYYIQCLNEWSKNDENLMKELEASEKRLTNKIDETQHKLSEKADETMEEIRKVQSMLQTLNKTSEESNLKDVAESYSQRLKSVMKNQLEVHQEFLMTDIIEKLKLQDIFTNLIVQDTPREYSQARKSSLVGGKTNTDIKESADLFLSKENTENPKSILIVGKPGIGKSLFCRKIAHEWTQDCIFNAEEGNPDINFTFLITFKQLSVHADKHLSLKELLNLCSMLDESTLLSDSIMNYIIQHPEQLFVLIDGYDEYKQTERHKLVSDFEGSFPNDPLSKMPVTALVSKLVKKKLLRDSVVMVTSRPSEADEMENLHFDRFVKITGFSLEQVREYVGNYFQFNEEMKVKALRDIEQNQYFLRFGRVPLMCLMMCVYMESQITEGSNHCLPEKLTDFYSEVVQCIERRYNKAIRKACLDKVRTSSVVQKNLDTLSELAALSTVHGKYSFDESDLKNLNLKKKPKKTNLSEEELTFLKSSSLLFCDGGVKKSALSELTHEYSFTHRTFQEYFAARYFVKMNEIPAQNTLSPMFLKFMSGSMDPVKDEELMKRLLDHIIKHEKDKDTQTRLSLKCVSEYGDIELVKIVVKENIDMYIDNSDVIQLRHFDYRVIALIIDAISSLEQEGSFRYTKGLSIVFYLPLTLSDVDTLFKKSLSNHFCPIKYLSLCYFHIDDKCAIHLSKYLSNTKLNSLNLSSNKITDNGVIAMIPYCNKLMHLDLRYNPISDECKRHVRAVFKDKYPRVTLFI